MCEVVIDDDLLLLLKCCYSFGFREWFVVIFFCWIQVLFVVRGRYRGMKEISEVKKYQDV